MICNRTYWEVDIIEVIFLDIDGVLNDMNYYKDNKLNTAGLERHLSREYMNNLNAIIDYSNWEVVVISSWVNVNNKEQLEKMFKDRGFRHSLKTLKEINDSRAETVRRYIDLHSIARYLIIDDEYRKAYIEQGIPANNILETNFYKTGLNKENTEKAKELIRNINSN